jgi:hypothetical protein
MSVVLGCRCVCGAGWWRQVQCSMVQPAPYFPQHSVWVYIILFFSAGDRTQDLTHVKQEVYLWATCPALTSMFGVNVTPEAHQFPISNISVRKSYLEHLL